MSRDETFKLADLKELRQTFVKIRPTKIVVHPNDRPMLEKLGIADADFILYAKPPIP